MLQDAILKGGFTMEQAERELSDKLGMCILKLAQTHAESREQRESKEQRLNLRGS